MKALSRRPDQIQRGTQLNGGRLLPSGAPSTGGSIRALVWLFTVACVWTGTLAPVGEGLAGRLIPADLLAGGMLVLASLPLAAGRTIPAMLRAYMVLLLALVAGSTQSQFPQRVAAEVFILAYLGAVCYAVVATQRSESGFFTLISATSVGLLVTAGISAVTLLSGNTGPNSGTDVAVAVGGFRNSGQAGAYVLVALAILLPVRLSRLYECMGRRDRTLVNAACVMGGLLLVATVKMAAWAGFGFGFALYAMRVSRKRLSRVVAVLFSGATLLVASGWLLLEHISGFETWVKFKIETRSMYFDDESGFIADNWSRAARAFSDNPIFGSGLGAFVEQYSDFEVHSTYLKLLGEGGLTGTLAYCAVMFLLWRSVLRGAGRQNPFGDYLRHLSCFLAGCMVSWAYTFHLRKREFWVLVSVALIASSLAKGRDLAKARRESIGMRQ